MLRIYGFLLFILSMVGAGLGGAHASATMLGWGANLGALFLFWILLDLIVSREGLATLGELFAVDSLSKGVIVVAGGLATGLIASGFYHLDALILLPAGTLFVALGLFWILDFFLSGNDAWQEVRQRFAANHRPAIVLLAVLGVIDVLLLSAVQVEWGYLPPVLTLIVLAGLVLGADWIFARSRIWAVARHTVAEGVRMKIVLVFIVILLLLLPTIPLTVVGDGVTLTSRVQSFLAYSLGAVSFLLSLLTVFMACGALSNEIQDRHIFMIASKPIPRWQFFFGKWLGIAMLNAGLLLLAGATIWGFTAYLRTLPTSVPDDRGRLENEVLNVRYAMKVSRPDIEPLVQQRLRTLREEGRLEDLSVKGKAGVTQDIRREIEQSLRSHGPREQRTYAFKGLIVDRDSGEFLQLELKPVSPGGSFDKKFEIAYRFGDPDQYEQTMTEIRTATLLVERVNTLVCPAWAVNDQGTLYFHMVNLDPQYTMVFEGNDSMQLLFGLGTFHWNLFRALSIMWCKLALLTVMGLFMSSWVSYPVAALTTMLFFLFAVTATFLVEAVDLSAPVRNNADPLGLAGPVIRGISTGLLWVVPHFAEYNPIGNIVEGKVVTLMWVIDAVVKLTILRGALLGLAGCAILSKREVAEVSV